MNRESSKSAETAGLLLVIAGTLIVMGIITGEVFYPEGYTTKHNEISDLGATRPPDSVITQPASTIFNLAMITSGVMIITAMILIASVLRDPWIILPYGLFGLGVLGVGLFPGNMVPWHPISSTTVFLAGGVSAIATYRITCSFFRYFSLSLGCVSLLVYLFSRNFIPVLGLGGTERWVAYPIILWIISLGGYFLGCSSCSRN